MKYFAFCFIPIIMYSFSNNHNQNFSFLKKYENDSDKLISFFENNICSESKNLEECYKTLFEKELQDMVEEGGYNFEFNKSNIDSLFSELSPKFRNEIWIQNKDYLLFNEKGRYVKMLKKMSKNNFHIGRYIKSCTLSMYLIPSPIMEEVVIANYDSFNMDDKAYRLFVSIHFISIVLEREIYASNSTKK